MIKLELKGYADKTGNAAYNQKLSERRAEASANYIIGKGIAKKRVSPKGYGSTQPIHTDAAIEKLATEEEKEDAHRANRRAEFKIIK